MADKKVCFFVTPIGETDSEIRKRSDEILRMVIEPACSEYQYEVMRADSMTQTGDISRQVITQVINADLVIADLTGHNPNVFYEIAIRHSFKKPFIHLIQVGESIPFDIATIRTIHINYPDITNLMESQKTLKEFIKEYEDNPDSIDSPVASAVMLDNISKNTDDISVKFTQIMNKLDLVSSRTKDGKDPLEYVINFLYNTQSEPLTHLEVLYLLRILNALRDQGVSQMPTIENLMKLLKDLRTSIPNLIDDK